MPKGTKQLGQDQYKAALRIARAKDPDLSQAYSLLTKAEKLGNADATYALATWSLFGRHVTKSPRKAITLLKRATRRGSADAAFDLAIAYETGEVVEKNTRKAFELYLTAALRYKIDARSDRMYSFNEAAYEVARCYQHGIGIAADKALSRLWMIEAKPARQPNAINSAMRAVSAPNSRSSSKGATRSRTAL